MSHATTYANPPLLLRLQCLAAFVTLLLAWACCHPAWSATIIAEPSEITLESLDQPVTISLKTAAPISAEDIRTVKWFVDGQEYEPPNVNLKVVEGKVMLVPTENLPPGRYTLQVETPKGTSEILVYNPTPGRPVTIEKQAVVLGVTVPQLEEQLGIRAQAPAKIMKLNLSPVYYQGQTIVADMDVTTDHFYSWKVNGKEIKYGQGGHTFVYTFKEPGQNVITYTERFGTDIVASGIQTVDVVGRPVLVRQYIPGTEVRLEGPDGYTEYLWKVDGEAAGTGKTLTYVFASEGTHHVEVIAEKPKTTPYDEYRAITYDFVVKTS